MTSPADREGLVQLFIRSDSVAPFDLSRAPLLRVALLKMGPREHVLVVALHHIVSDGSSAQRATAGTLHPV